MSSGIDIIIELKKRKKEGKPYTQRWLLEELHKNGFPDLKEPTLSNILNDHYTVGCAADVLDKARMIVMEQVF